MRSKYTDLPQVSRAPRNEVAGLQCGSLPRAEVLEFWHGYRPPVPTRRPHQLTAEESVQNVPWAVEVYHVLLQGHLGVFC